MHNFDPEMRFSEVEELVHIHWLTAYANLPDVPADVLKRLYPNVSEFGVNGDATADFLENVLTKPGVRAALFAAFSQLPLSEILENFKMEWRLAPADADIGSTPYTILDSAIRHAMVYYEPLPKDEHIMVVYLAHALAAPGILPENGDDKWLHALTVARAVTRIVESAQ